MSYRLIGKSKNTTGKIILLIFLLVCSCLGIAAFAMSFRGCNKDGFDPTITKYKSSCTHHWWDTYGGDPCNHDTGGNYHHDWGLECKSNKCDFISECPGGKQCNGSLCNKDSDCTSRWCINHGETKNAYSGATCQRKPCADGKTYSNDGSGFEPCTKCSDPKLHACNRKKCRKVTKPCTTKGDISCPKECRGSGGWVH